MTINLFYIDLDVPGGNGLTTYTNQLLDYYQTQGSVKIWCFYLNSQRYLQIHEIPKGNITKIFVPFDKKIITDYDAHCAEIISNYADGKENAIVHFNWINHCPIAWHLKKSTALITVLTKHCIPWRDMVVGQYSQFLRIDKAFKRNLPLRIHTPKLKTEEIFYDSIDHVITVTEFAKKSLTWLFKMNSDKITVIRNGFGQRPYKIASEREIQLLKSKYGFDPNSRIVLFAGKLNPRKGVFDLVKAMEKLWANPNYSDVRLVIAGMGDYTLLLKSAKRFWARITLTGNLDSDTLTDFYKMSSIGVIPSYVEQCSYTAIEMMHYGLPLVVSNVDGLGEMISTDCGYQVHVNFLADRVEVSVKDLEAKIRSALSDQVFSKQLGIKARKYAGLHFTASRMGTDTIGVYKKLIKNSASVLALQSHRVQDNRVEQPLVTIILPCYNASEYITECLESIFKQTYSNFELLLIDDGSTDDTDEILKRQTDKRVIIIRNKKNVGITSSLNTAISQATGKYIARMDADDIMFPDRLQMQIGFLEKNPDYGLVGGAHNVIDRNGRPVTKVIPRLDDEEIKLSMLFWNPFAHPAITIRTDLLKQCMYDHEYNYCEDYDLWFRIAEKCKVANLKSTVISYRVHNGNTSGQNSKIMKQGVMTLLSRELDKLNIDHSPRELVLHSSIGFGYSRRYLNTSDKVTELTNWLDRLFNAPKVIDRFSVDTLAIFRRQMMDNIFGLS